MEVMDLLPDPDSDLLKMRPGNSVIFPRKLDAGSGGRAIETFSILVGVRGANSYL
jgi:hypothetical protein